MSLVIYYNQKNQFELTKEEFQSVMDEFKSGNNQVVIKRLNVILTDKFIWAGQSPENKDIGYLHDGRKVIKKFEQWVLADDPDLKIDAKYYPEVLRDNVYTEKEWLEIKDSKKLLE